MIKPGWKEIPMPLYEYEHLGRPCDWGQVFEQRQSMAEPCLERCPNCGAPVSKRMSRINISTPKTNSELKDLGFTKLVRRDDGVYENVTARNGDSRYMVRGRPDTLPNVKRTITD
jgi:putative FmdB family regulatory protein